MVIFKRGKRESKNRRPALAENPISEDVLVSEELPDEEVFVAEENVDSTEGPKWFEPMWDYLAKKGYFHKTRMKQEIS